jgi:hypothetical protein
MAATSEKVLPCPFCGSAPTLENYVTEAAVHCWECRLMLARRHTASEDTGISEAAAAWNRRAADERR